MSKFWATENGSDEEDRNEENEDRNDDGGEEEEEDLMGKRSATPSSTRVEEAKPKKSMFSVEDSDSDEGETRRVVVSHAQKKVQEFKAVIKAIGAHAKADAWGEVSNDLDKLLKLGAKPTNSFSKEVWPPRDLLHGLSKIQFLYTTREQDTDTKLPGQCVKIFRAMKTRMKKIYAPFAKDLALYNADPDESEIEPEEPKDSDVDENEDESPEPIQKEPEEDEGETEEKPAPAGRSKWTKKAKADSESSEDEQKDEPETSDSDDFMRPNRPRTREYWLKRPAKKEVEVKADSEVDEPEPTDEVDELPTEEIDESELPPDEEVEVIDEEEQQRRDEAEARRKRKAAKAEAKKEEMTPDAILKQLEEICSSRGRKGVKPLLQAARLSRYLKHAIQIRDWKLALRLSVVLTAVEFDTTPRSAEFMLTSEWNKCVSTLIKVLDILDQDRSLVVQEENAPVAESQEGEAGITKLSILTFIERLDDQFIKSLQHLDPHTSEYLQRMNDEPSLVSLAQHAYTYYVRVKNARNAARCALVALQHTYYRRPAANPSPTTIAAEAKQQELVHELCSYIINNGEDRIRARAVLCRVYYDALHDLFYEARDLLLTSHLQEVISDMDHTHQVLFNRSMVQLGMCAFRKGLVYEAHGCLQDMYSGTPIKELLGQGFSQQLTRMQERDPVLERIEKARQVPYHMHINLELVEACYLLAAMLIEIPGMAAQLHASHGVPDPSLRKRQVVNRNFRRLIEAADKQPFYGPPQYVREVVVAASRHLRSCDWRKCTDLVLGLKAWSFITPAASSAALKTLLKSKIQEAAFKTFLFHNSRFYTSITLARLCELFDLPQNIAHSILCRMLSNEELINASLDQPSNILVFHPPPTHTQAVSLMLADKLASLVENNEHVFETRTASLAPPPPPQSSSTGSSSSYFGGYRGRQSRGEDQSESGSTGRYGRGRGGENRYRGGATQRPGRLPDNS
ncbi:Eukaryotic translation initiation factor 3 subunit C [Pelomyxa schiedti]|nr:Eukaryotic translation initiation factor 3 subunit C [Pelomyxa schiedti]